MDASLYAVYYANLIAKSSIWVYLALLKLVIIEYCIAHDKSISNLAIMSQKLNLIGQLNRKSDLIITR